MKILALSTLNAVALVYGGSFADAAPTQQRTTATLLPQNAEKIQGTVRDAGIYHVATGSWTRTGGATADFGPDVVYCNTFSSGYFSSTGLAGGFSPGGTIIDEGSIPTSLNTNYANANRDSYSINCIELGYCDLGAAATGGWELTFYSAYAPCSIEPSPTATLAFTGLPASGCWMIAFDLTGGSEFCLAGDGGGLSGPSPTKTFGWGVKYIGTDGTAPAGLFLAGHPAATDPTFVPGGGPTDGTGTYYGPASLCPGGSTGQSTADFFWLEDPTGMNSGCYFFGGYNGGTNCAGPFLPYSSFFLELQADTSICGISPGPYEYCQSNPNSTGATSTIELTGCASVSANNVNLTATLPPNTFGFFLTSQTQGFAANPGGSAGNICLTGDVGRFVGTGQVKNSGASGEISLSTGFGEWSLASIPAGMGPYAAVAGMQTNFQLWHRDTTPAGAGSNFSNGYSVTWTN